MALLLRILINIFDSILGIIFVISFTKSEIPRGKKLLVCCMVAVTLLMFSEWDYNELLRFLFSYKPTISHYYKSLVRIAALYIISFGLGKSNIISKLVAPVIFESVFVYLISSHWMTVVSNVLNSPVINMMTTTVTAISTVVMVRILMTSVLFFIVKATTYTGRYRVITTVTYILSPILTLFILYLFLKILFYRVNEYSIEIIIAIVGTAAVNILTFYLFNRTVASEKENSKLQLCISKAEMERTKYAEMQRASEELNAIKHDMKNQLIGINKFAIDGDVEIFNEHVASLNRAIESIGKQVVTGNSMLDYIISSKFHDKGDIKLVVTGSIGNINSVDYIDLAVLVGNLIDNATEAVSLLDKQEKLVEFNLSEFDGYQNIIIKNSIERSVLEGNSELASTKSEVQRHGFGIKSIKNIVKKYDGYIKCYEEVQKFCVHVALPIE